MQSISYDYIFLVNVLETYVNNNYSYEKLSEIFSSDKKQIYEILSNDEAIKSWFGNRTWNILEEHKATMKRYHFFNSSSLMILGNTNIQIRGLLRNPNDNTIYFTKQQIMSLNILRSCYMYNGDLSLVAKQYGISINSLFAYLSSPKLEEVLSDSAFLYLQTLLSFKFLYFGNEITKRKDYFNYLLSCFYEFNGSLIQLSQATMLSIPVLRNLLASSEFAVLTGLKASEKKWVLEQLKKQEKLFDSLEDEVGEQILFHRTNMLNTSRELGIRRAAVKKLVKSKIPEKNPFRGVLIQEVLSTLGDRNVV